MRFFSNEAKENADGQEAADTEHDRTESDTATVPHQRSGSPWSDTPGSGNATSTEPSDRAEAEPDGTADPLRDDDEVRAEGADTVRGTDTTHDEVDLPLEDRPVTEERAEDRTGTDEFPAGSHRAEGADDSPFGDSRVEGSALGDRTTGEDRAADDSVTGDAVRDDAVRDDAERDDPLRGGSVGVASADDSRVAEEPGAEQRGGTTTTYGPDGTRTTVDEPAGTATDRADNASVTEPDTADRVTDEDRDLDEAAPVVATAPVGGTAGGSAATDSPTADSTPIDAPLDGADARTADDSDAGPAPEVAAVPVGAAGATADGAAKPDPAAAPVGDRLFADGDSFNDRLRDIALNFVDNPKEATEQAGTLVDEAIEKVTSALKAQKDALAGEGDDTEKLRVQLRGYRDILKRLTAL